MAKIVWNPGPLLSEVKTKAAQKMYQTVTVLVNEARRIVPVRTGYLKSSLTCEVTADGRTGFYGSFRPWAGEKSVEYACVAPPFPVLTAEGAKDVSELSAEDALCTPSGFRKPALAFSKPWEGELVRIELKGFPFPLRLTPDHVLPVVPSFPCPFERSYVYLCRPDCKYHRCNRHLSCERSASLSLTWKSASALSLTDYLVFPIWRGEDVRPIAISWRWTRENPLRNYHREFLVIPDEDIAWLAGLYVAEGFLSARHFSHFVMHENEKEHLERLYAIARFHFGATLTRKFRSGRSLAYVFCSRPLQIFLKHFGCGAAKKIVPNFVFEWPSELRRAFLQGYFLGDGTVAKHEVKASTVSLSLALGLYVLASLEGIRPNLRRASMPVGNRVVIDGRESWIRPRYQPWIVAFSRYKAALLGLASSTVHREKREAQLDRFMLLPIAGLRYVPYKGPVYDVSFEGSSEWDHAFLLGPVLSRNCFVELGTRKMSPRPYLRPPLETKREEIKRIWSG